MEFKILGSPEAPTWSVELPDGTLTAAFVTPHGAIDAAVVAVRAQLEDKLSVGYPTGSHGDNALAIAGAVTAPVVPVDQSPAVPVVPPGPPIDPNAPVEATPAVPATHVAPQYPGESDADYQARLDEAGEIEPAEVDELGNPVVHPL